MLRAARGLLASMEPLIAVIGATGTGKSQLAVDLASRFNGEIINADAMQLYRGLPIITNQVQPHEMGGVPHHLLAINSIEDETWQVGVFRRECLRVIAEIRSRGKVPVLVGGTHYYAQAVLFNEPLVDTRGSEGGVGKSAEAGQTPREGERPADDTARDRFAILERPTAEILSELRKVDPVMASRWHPNEDRKIRRSLEIYLQTGRRASDIYDEQRRRRGQLRQSVSGPSPSEQAGEDEMSADLPFGALRFRTVLFWVHSAADELRQRLNSRVDKMEERGLIAEAEQMFDYLQQQREQGIEIDRSRGIWVSIGFKELEPFIKAIRGSSDSDAASGTDVAQLRQWCLEAVKSSTRKYAKQQLRWIKGKLWTSLVAAGAEDRLFVVDTTDPSNWDHDALGPAERVTAAFLNGSQEPLPNPLETSAFARQTLEPLWQSRTATVRDGDGERGTTTTTPLSDGGQPLRNITCDVCRVTVLSGPQWTSHVESARHRRCVKLAQKKAEMLRNNPHYRAAREARAKAKASVSTDASATADPDARAPSRAPP
ncbi:hypothetical protein KEM52_005264 [Ascosphaera acerosa]|nr:hypothetical protein KEM52_005264 [Ascosphaera acerosa]